MEYNTGNGKDTSLIRLEDINTPRVDTHVNSVTDDTDRNVALLSDHAAVGYLPDSKKRAKRDQWSSHVDFMLACVGFAVGLGNIWRFPYLCYKNGGGVFLIPYLLCLVTCGIPIFLLEIGLGQYMSIGSIYAWRIAPAFQGIGVASLVITFLMNIYYVVVLAWALYYLVRSCTSVLPWSHCGNDWNSPRCFTNISKMSTVSIANNCNVSQSMPGSNCTMEPNVAEINTTTTVDPVIEFWERQVLHISRGVDQPGSIVWQLALSLLVVWTLVYFCVWRGVRWSGKVVYFTALFPYVILTCLLIRGVTLDGAADGIWFYVKPDLSKLWEPQVWIDGGTQICFSYAIAIGAMVTLGSYNAFNNGFYRQCFIIAGVNSFTSLYGGFAVFSVLGFMAKEQNVTIADVAESGPGLVFIAYPKAITQMPMPQLWAVLFFLMILLVGLDSQFVAVEGFLAPVMDFFPNQLYKLKNRMLITGVYCGVSYLLGLSMVTEGGMYVFQLFDYYSASGLVLLWVIMFESLVVGWCFGADRFYDAIELMIGSRITPWFKLCWRYITPATTLAIFLFITIKFSPLTYNKTYIYPPGAQAFGLSLAIASMICIPLVFLYNLVTAPGANIKQKWRVATTPILQQHQIHPHWKCQHRGEQTGGVI